MGIQLVNVAIAAWAPHVSDRAFRVLLKMAATALDKPSNGHDAATFFGGYRLLAMTLRGGEDDPSYRTVRRAISELLAVGALESVDPARRGSRAEYRLTLDADPKPKSGQSCPHKWTELSSDSGAEGQPSPEIGQSVSNIGRGTTGTTSREDPPDDEVVPFETSVQNAREDLIIGPISLGVESDDRSAICRRCRGPLEPDDFCTRCGIVQLRSVS